MAIKCEVKGLKQLAAKLRDLRKRKASAIFKAAIHAGATEMKRGIAVKTPVRRGNLKKGLKTKKMRTGSGFYAQSIVMSTKFYGYMVEYGFKTVKTGRYFPGTKRRWSLGTSNEQRKKSRGQNKAWRKSKDGAVISQIPARPFMRPGFDTSKDRTLNRIGFHLGKAIIKEFKNLANN